MPKLVSIQKKLKRVKKEVSTFSKRRKELRSIDFTLPVKAVSINNYYKRRATGQIRISEKGIFFRQLVRNAAEYISERYGKIHGVVQISMVFGFKGKRKRIDVDNLPKPFIDAIKNIIMDDDHLVKRIIAEKRIDQPTDYIKCSIISTSLFDASDPSAP